MATVRALNDRISWERFAVYFALLLMVATLLYVKGGFYLSGDISHVVSDVPDDAAYFYKTARNIASGKGMTFDGINPTNGFQPLWLYVLVPVAWVLRDAPVETYFRAAIVFQLLLTIISGLLFFLSLSRVVGKPLALFGTALFYLFARLEFINGMETGVLVLCLAGLFAFSHRYRVFVDSNPVASFGFGVLSGLLLLARLDMVFLIATIYALVLGHLILLKLRGEPVMAQVRDVLISIIGLAIVSSPYFIYNKIVFGAIMPISGQLKNTFPHVVQPEFGLGRFRSRDLVVVGLAGLFIMWATVQWISIFKKQEATQYLLLTGWCCAIAILLHYLNTALFMKWAVFDWHFAFYYFSLCIFLTTFFARLVRSLSDGALKLVPIGAVGAALGVALLVGAWGQPKRYTFRTAAYEAGVWARQNTPENAIFAMKDAGVFGLFSQRVVINLDGLVNNMKYQEALRQKRLNQYLAEKGVMYLVQHAFWEKDINRLTLSGEYKSLEMRYVSHRYGTLSDPIRVYRTDEVYRSKPYYDGPYRTVFLIWRLRHDAHQR